MIANDSILNHEGLDTMQRLSWVGSLIILWAGGPLPVDLVVSVCGAQCGLCMSVRIHLVLIQDMGPAVFLSLDWRRKIADGVRIM